MVGKVISSAILANDHPLPELVRSGAFSPGLKAGPFVFVSGCVAKDTNKDIKGQTTEILEYINKVLKEVGYTMQDIVKVQAFITDKANYSSYNEIRKQYFTQDPPASTSIVTDLLFPNVLIEIDAVAYKP